MANPIRVGITHGDFNGISYEIILKALQDEMMTEICTPVLFGSAKFMRHFIKTLDMPEVRFKQVATAAEATEGTINVVSVYNEEAHIEPGQPSEVAGQAARIALDAAVEALKNGEIDVLVTAPINKQTIHCEDFPFTGHTEYLQSRLGGEHDEALMILFDDYVRVALVTTHLPLKELPDAITKARVADSIRAFNASLKRDFAIERPKIAVLSLNPHNGDNGLLGDEEQKAIIPAIEEVGEERIMAFGPMAADGFFATKAYLKYDGVLAMYHDQGLAPFKALAEGNGVNFTAGLPYVRTSPDHGTGYDIAGRNVASADSMRQAIYRAIDIYRDRRAYELASANPLRTNYVERGADKTVDLTKEEITND